MNGQQGSLCTSQDKIVLWRESEAGLEGQEKDKWNRS